MPIQPHTLSTYAASRADDAVAEAERDDDHSLYIPGVSISDTGLNGYGQAIYDLAYTQAAAEWTLTEADMRTRYLLATGDHMDRMDAAFGALGLPWDEEITGALYAQFDAAPPVLTLEAA